MMKSNGLKTGVIVALIAVFATAALGTGSWMIVRVNDHESRLAVVEVVLDRIDENVKKLLETR